MDNEPAAVVAASPFEILNPIPREIFNDFSEFKFMLDARFGQYEQQMDSYMNFMKSHLLSLLHPQKWFDELELWTCFEVDNLTWQCYLEISAAILLLESAVWASILGA